MSDNFLGLTPESSQFPMDPFTGDGVTQIFNLKRTPAGNNSVLVYVGGVPQSGGSSFNIRAKTIVFTEAPPKDAPILVYHKGERSVISQPAVNSVGLEQLQDNLKDFKTQYITINGSASYILNYPVGSSASIQVTADSAVQRPEIDYTVNPITNTITPIGMPNGINLMILFLGVKGVINAPAAGTVLHDSLSAEVKTTLYRAPFRNKLINGNFDIWQRGTTQSVAGYGSVDRWNNLHVGCTKVTNQQAFSNIQTDVPGNPKYFLRTVVNSVAGAGNNCYTWQAIENVATLAGKKATLSFYAKADSAKNIAIELGQRFGAGGSSEVAGIGGQKILLSNSWNKYVITIDIPDIKGKVIGTDSTHSLRLLFWFDAGSDYAARASSLGNQSGTFDIAQVQLEEGSIATDFEERPIATELVLCHRYYENSWYPQYSGPTGGAGGTTRAIARTVYLLAGCTTQYKIIKRTVPSLSVYDYVTGIAGNIAEQNVGSIYVTTRAATLVDHSNRSFGVMASATATPDLQYLWHWSADSEL